MNKTFVVCAVISAAMATGGCTSVWEAKWGTDKPHISFVSLQKDEKQPDKIYVWNPNNNAAYVFQNGDQTVSACVASADVAKARSRENNITVDVGAVLDKVDSAKIEDKTKIIDSITKLSERDEAASFLNVALFHICMLSGANKLSPSDVPSLVKASLDAASKAGKNPDPAAK